MTLEDLTMAFQACTFDCMFCFVGKLQTCSQTCGRLALQNQAKMLWERQNCWFCFGLPPIHKTPTPHINPKVNVSLEASLISQNLNSKLKTKNTVLLSFSQYIPIEAQRYARMNNSDFIGQEGIRVPSSNLGLRWVPRVRVNPISVGEGAPVQC